MKLDKVPEKGKERERERESEGTPDKKTLTKVIKCEKLRPSS